MAEITPTGEGGHGPIPDLMAGLEQAVAAAREARGMKKMLRFGDVLDEDGFPRCRCGKAVAVPHQSCLSLMPPAERDAWLGRDSGSSAPEGEG